MIKPRLVSYFIYYKKLSEIETISHFSKVKKINYLKKQLKEIDEQSNKNKYFINYYYSKQTHKDTKYFTRNNSINILHHDNQIINYDFRVSTSHDHLIATILANDKLIIYIENLLENLYNLIKTIETPTKYNWSGNKIELVELIYALKEQNVINNGVADIKEIAKLFEIMFNVELEENIYRWYLDIKKRKISRTKFLNQLAENLIKRMDREDE
ncbi:RteC domain-containing protein [Flavobacterium sp. SUN046]|uniref:RteC domain-containing protein n=1 Tax=Flavobacterium sp. SUN046 TaxID=3002440 RepID=UPI002DB6FA6E|nr:RteC domain-containing protein [Flavobacterium sp. SUN046]MEC4049142.1 RteC domain-containing protein [Flavobacterium sp. SUN046]